MEKTDSFGGMPNSVSNSEVKSMQDESRELQEQITEQLKQGKNLLIQSIYGRGIKTSLQSAAQEIGLSLLSLEGDKVLGSADDMKSELDRTKGKAIVIGGFSDNSETYISVAKERNIPIIAVLYSEDSKLKISSFDTPELMMSTIDKLPLPPFKNHLGLNTNVLDRMRNNNIMDSELSDSNKPRQK